MFHKKVLLIAGQFPPEGGGGVVRACKMAKYLGNYGYQVYVLTRPPVHDAAIDEELLSELPSSISITRVRQPAFLDQRLPLRYFRWALAGFFVGKKLIEHEKIDVLWTTSPPPPAHLLGYFLKRATNIPWVVDFRDPWTQYMPPNVSAWRKRLEENMERSVIAAADVVTTVTPSFLENFQVRFDNLIRRIELIYNGFDPEDYTNIVGSADNNKFTAVYAGILYSTRSPGLLLEAIAELIREGDVKRSDIQLQFAGQLDAPGETAHYDLVQQLGLEDVVKVMGALPHRQALEMLESADLLLLIGDTSSGAADYIPGKLYEYMAMGRPILALQVDGEAQRIIETHHLGTVAHPQDKEAIKRAYLDLYQGWRDKKLPTKTKSVQIEVFNRRFQAYQLAELMDSLIHHKESE